MKEVISNLKVGDPMQEDTDMGPMININAAKRIEEQVNKMVVEGATVVWWGKKREDAYYYPTILDNVTKIWKWLRIWKFLDQLFLLLDLRVKKKQ